MRKEIEKTSYYCNFCYFFFCCLCPSSTIMKCTVCDCDCVSVCCSSPPIASSANAIWCDNGRCKPLHSRSILPVATFFPRRCLLPTLLLPGVRCSIKGTAVTVVVGFAVAAEVKVKDKFASKVWRRRRSDIGITKSLPKRAAALLSTTYLSGKFMRFSLVPFCSRFSLSLAHFLALAHSSSSIDLLIVILSLTLGVWLMSRFVWGRINLFLILLYSFLPKSHCLLPPKPEPIDLSSYLLPDSFLYLLPLLSWCGDGCCCAMSLSAVCKQSGKHNCHFNEIHSYSHFYINNSILFLINSRFKRHFSSSAFCLCLFALSDL